MENGNKRAVLYVKSIVWPIIRVGPVLFTGTVVFGNSNPSAN